MCSYWVTVQTHTAHIGRHAVERRDKIKTSLRGGFVEICTTANLVYRNIPRGGFSLFFLYTDSFFFVRMRPT